MKSHLIRVPTVGMERQDWLAYRMTGIGASEVGSILGLDDYTSSLELFHYKIGNVPKLDVETMASFMGREQEDFVAKLWQYWQPGGEEEHMMENYRSGRVVRRCRRIKAFIRNPAYPWMYVSLDRVADSFAGRGEGIVECKTIGGFESDKWEAGLPPKHVVQVQTQLLVTELLWGELPLFEDGRRFHVLPFEPSESIQGHIIDRTFKFWERVKLGRRLVAIKMEAMLQHNHLKAQAIEAEIDQLAPEPDGTLAYANYLSERYQQANKLERAGSLQELTYARRQQELAIQVKGLEEEKRLMETSLKSAMGDHQVLNFGKDGKVYWSNLANGGRQFRNRLKQD